MTKPYSRVGAAMLLAAATVAICLALRIGPAAAAPPSTMVAKGDCRFTVRDSLFESADGTIFGFLQRCRFSMRDGESRSRLVQLDRDFRPIAEHAIIDWHPVGLGFIGGDYHYATAEVGAGADETPSLLEIWRHDSRTGQAEKVTHRVLPGYANLDAALPGDGVWLLRASPKVPNQLHPYLLLFDGKTLTPIAMPEGEQVGLVAWSSPYGGFLIRLSGGNEGSSRVMVVKPDGSLAETASPAVPLPAFSRYREGRLFAAADAPAYLTFNHLGDRYLVDVALLGVGRDLSWSKASLKQIEAVGFGNLQGAISPSGRYVAVGFVDDYVEVIRTSGTRKQVFRKRLNGDAELLFTADEKSLIVLDDQRMTRLPVDD